MAETKVFRPVKLICGVIASEDLIFNSAEAKLRNLYGKIESESSLFPFDFTDYYEKQMGQNLKRKFLSFKDLINPERLSEIKLQTNNLEETLRVESKSKQRKVNLDPGYLTPSALVIATTKDFAHRIPLQDGIYAHLELLFTKKGPKVLSWTYPDFKTKTYHAFFTEVRRIYLAQLR